MPLKPNAKATSKRAKPRGGAKPPAKQGTVTGDEAIIKQARAEADASEAAARSALMNDPAFIAWTKSTEGGARACKAALKACKPYDDAILRLAQAHPNGFAPGSKDARDFAALRSARDATERRTLAEHGYPVHDGPDTPGRLLELVEALESSRRMMALVGVGIGPSGDALTDREATKLWDRAAAMCGAKDSLPGLPMPAKSGAERLHQLREWCALCNADQAYGAASEFLTHLGTFVFHSRHHAGQTSSGKKADWGSMYAMAFIPAFDLPLLVSSDVKSRARAVHSADAHSIRLGRLRPHASVIEAVAELASVFRNVLFADRRCPLDPDFEQFMEPAKARATEREVAAGRPAAPMGWGADFEELKRGETRAAVRKRLGIKSRFEAEELIAAEWRAQTLEHEAAVHGIAQLKSIDLDELAVMLGREAGAVIRLSTQDVTDMRPREVLVEGKPARQTSASKVEGGRVLEHNPLDAVGPSASRTNSMSKRLPKMRVDDKAMKVFLGRDGFAVDDMRTLRLLDKLIDADGAVISSVVLSEGFSPKLRVDRLLDKLPAEIQARIGSKRGCGYWLILR